MHLIYFSPHSTYSRAEKDAIISNNEFACRACLVYLSREEQQTCDL